MEKEKIIKALALCAGLDGDVSCNKCCYFGTPECNKRLNEDTISLLKANDNPVYHTAIIYTKRDNLSKWLQSNLGVFRHCTATEISRVREEYAREREIQLILLVRHEEGKCICRIKCPINPLPIKGEFECVSTSEMTRLLAAMGWRYKEKLRISMFR